MKSDNALKLFGLNNISLESELHRIQRDLDIKLGKKDSRRKDETYYPQFHERLRDEAASMAIHYEIFYCLENSIRNLIVERLEEEIGLEWWDMDKVVPQFVKDNAKKIKLLKKKKV